MAVMARLISARADKVKPPRQTDEFEDKGPFKRAAYRRNAKWR